MEFEYQNKAGKMDESSPFAKLRPGTFSNQAFGSSFAHNTPSRKPTFAVPYLPQTPKTQADRFRDRFDTDASSGTEQSSPEAADTEETPAIRKLNQNVTISRGHGTTPSKPSPLGTKSFFGSGLFTSNAIRKERLRNANQHAALVRKSHKRKRRELERDNQISFEWPNHQDSDYDDTSRPGTSEGPPTERPAKEVGTIPAILGFIHAHPDLPAILARYGHSLLSWFIVMMFIYMTYAFWAAIKQDVDIKKGEFSAKILSEMAICGKHYIDNRCAPGMRAPALKDLCEEWDMCMHQDPDAVGQAKVSAHTWAEIFSAFVEPLSYKLMVCILYKNEGSRRKRFANLCRGFSSQSSLLSASCQTLCSGGWYERARHRCRPRTRQLRTSPLRRTAASMIRTGMTGSARHTTRGIWVWAIGMEGTTARREDWVGVKVRRRGSDIFE